MAAILGGLGAALAWAATTLAASRATRLVDPRSLLATVMTVGLVVAAPAAGVAGIPHGIDAREGTWLVVSGLGNVVGLLFTYSALRVGKVGLVAPVTSTEGAVAAVVALLAGESLPASHAIVLAAIAIGVALAARTPATGAAGAGSETRAAVLACGAALSFGIGLYATGKVGQGLGVAWAALPPRVVGVAVLALPLALARRWRLTRAALPYAIVGGICEVLGFVSYAWGARHGLAVSAVLASQFAGIAAVVGFLAFRERLAHVQIAGVIVIVAGVSVLSALPG